MSAGSADASRHLPSDRRSIELRTARGSRTNSTILYSLSSGEDGDSRRSSRCRRMVLMTLKGKPICYT